MIIGSNHFMTYDRTHYDFSSGCSYLLAHDFIDGNFTVVVDYERDLTVGGRSKSIVLYLNDTDVYEIKQDFTVSNKKERRVVAQQSSSPDPSSGVVCSRLWVRIPVVTLKRGTEQ